MFVYVIMYVCMYVCSQCNGYHRRKWICRPMFKSLTSFFPSYRALIPFRKVCIQLLSLNIGINLLRPLVKEQKKNLHSNHLNYSFRTDLMSNPRSVARYIYIYIYIYIEREKESEREKERKS